LNKKTLIFPVILIAISLIGYFALGPLIVEYHHQHTGTVIVNIGIYLDDTPLLNDTLLDWGTLYPDDTHNFGELQVNNNQTVSLTITLLTSMPTDWAMTWTANNTILAPGEWANATLTLYVPATATEGNYGWSSILRGTQT